jgi:hypothetical protein
MGAFGSASIFPSLNPGDLRHWIWFLEQSTSQPTGADDCNNCDTGISWAKGNPPLGAWAKIEAVRGTDLIRAGLDSTILYLTVTIWYQPGVSAQMHILSPTNCEYVINSVENVLLMNHILVLNCQAIGAQANFGG